MVVNEQFQETMGARVISRFEYYVYIIREGFINVKIYSELEHHGFSCFLFLVCVMCAHAQTCEGQTLSVFLDCFPPYCLRQCINELGTCHFRLDICSASSQDIPVSVLWCWDNQHK